MGLLDGFSDFAKTPEGQGLLAATFGGLASAQRGAPINSLGRAGLAGLSGYGNAQDRDLQAARAEQQKKMQDQSFAHQQMQMDAAKREAERKATIDAGMGKFFTPAQQARPSLPSMDGALPPELRTGAAPMVAQAAKPAGFDAGGAAQFLAQNGDYESALRLMPKPKELAVNKLDVKDFTPASVQKFAQTGSYADLVRMDKAQFQNTGGLTMALDPFTGKPLNAIENTQSPDSKASNVLGWANNALSRQRFDFDKNGGGEGGASQAGLNKQFGKPQAGYRWKADGSLEFIPGGPADQKAQMKTSGEGTVDSVVADLRDKYDKLNTGGGIVNDKDGMFGNIGASIASSGLGQTIGGAVGTKNQTSRDNISMTRPLLLQSIMKATGMSAKQMDSNAELKLYLATATDPTKGYQANMEALQRIEDLYGGGQKAGNAQPPATPKPSDSANLMPTLPTANASNKGRKIRDTTTGKVLVSNGMSWKEE